MKLKSLILIFVLLPNLAFAEARQIDDYQWEGVERIVAIGDIHGDYNNYMATLQAAGLVDRKGKWAGGKTHFVQVGDIPDRGPDTLKIIEHISQLAKQARRKGGRVHSLIGNHEVLNVIGDLRYVHPGEYEAFADRKSKTLRDRYFKLYIEHYQQSDPEGFAQLPEDFRAQWEKEHPLGWMEHRQAWDPQWNSEAEYAKWVMDKKVAVRINDNLFLHGGISGFYCGNSLDSLTERAVAELADWDPEKQGILTDPNGPLWYRGLSGKTPGMAPSATPPATPETVDAILANHGANHIVVGHTPTMGVIWPEYDGKVVVIDIGMSSHYGGYIGYLEISPEGRFAGYQGGKLPLPASDDERTGYLQKVIEFEPENPYLKKRLQSLTLGPPAETAPAPETGTMEEAAEPAVPICGTS